MDPVLAQRSGQELCNFYTITENPAFAPLRQFFTAAVDQLQLLYDDASIQECETSMTPAGSLIDCMRNYVSTDGLCPTVHGSDFSAPVRELYEY